MHVLSESARQEIEQEVTKAITIICQGITKAVDVANQQARKQKQMLSESQLERVEMEAVRFVTGQLQSARRTVELALQRQDIALPADKANGASQTRPTKKASRKKKLATPTTTTV